MNRLKATVIVPAYNAEQTITHCLDSLLAQETSPNHAFEIIVVDDVSTDNTVKIVQQYPVQLINDGVKRGKSNTRNYGAQIARGEILLFTDSDCIPSAEWIETMLRPFADETLVGLKGQYNCDQQSPVARFIQVEHEERYVQMAQHPTTNFIDTYSAAFRRDIFLANGGFDPQLTFSMVEDQEFSFRLAHDQHKMIFYPEAEVTHQHITSAWAYCERKFWIASWKALIVKRHPERFKSDTRTPKTIKYQMVLILAGMALLPLTIAIPSLRKLWVGWMGTFLLTTIPFLRHASKRDSIATMVALPMLLGRAIALTLGYLHGLWRWRGNRASDFLQTNPPVLQDLGASHE